VAREGRGARRRGQQGRGTGLGQGERDAWKLSKQEVERRWQHNGGGAVLCTGGRGGRVEQHVLEEEEERGVVRGGLFGNLRNLRDLSVN
jgi:hypothetical protein